MEIKAIFTILAAWILIILVIIFTQGNLVDESTHSFVGLFLRDLAKDWLSNPTFSFKKVYNYATAYLAYYPKISLHYPPVPQIFFALAYSVFEPSLIVSRIVVLLFSIGLAILVYFFTYKIFRKREIALLAVLTLITSPIVVLTSTQALQEIPFAFFFLLTIFLFLKAFEKANLKNFVLASVSTVFCVLSKWQAVTIFPVVLIYGLLVEKKNLKYLIFSFCLAALILSPYYFILWKTNLLLVPLKANLEADLHDPTWLELRGWTYYLEALVLNQFFFPIGLILLFSTCLYIKNKKKNWKLFLIWIATVFVIMVFVHNKDARYDINILPAFVIPSSFMVYSFLKKRKIFVWVFLALIVSQLLFALTSLPKGASNIQEISEYVVEKSKGNILMTTELGTGSEFIFEIARIDRFRHQVFRSCLVEDYNNTFDDLIKEFGIEYVIASKELKTDKLQNFYQYITKSRNFEVEREFKEFLIIRNKNFVGKPEKICNYICATREKICSEFKNPREALR